MRGWDFSWLGERLRTTSPPWDFDAIVVARARRSRDLLDVGTGGGEWLAALRHRPPRTVALESWPPNLEVARALLTPLGVEVLPFEAARDNAEQDADEEGPRLPVPSRSFSLVTARHESFLAREIARVLAPGGRFLTQQVGGDYGDFHEALGLARPAPPARRWDLRLATEQLRAAGLRVVDGAEGAEAVAFADAGAFAWYLRAIPWAVEGFAVATHRPQLERLQARIVAEGPLTATLPAFWLEASS